MSGVAVAISAPHPRLPNICIDYMSYYNVLILWRLLMQREDSAKMLTTRDAPSTTKSGFAKYSPTTISWHRPGKLSRCNIANRIHHEPCPPPRSPRFAAAMERGAIATSKHVSLALVAYLSPRPPRAGLNTQPKSSGLEESETQAPAPVPQIALAHHRQRRVIHKQCYRLLRGTVVYVPL